MTLSAFPYTEHRQGSVSDDEARFVYCISAHCLEWQRDAHLSSSVQYVSAALSLVQSKGFGAL